MLRLIAGAIAVAWALAGWRNMPRLDHPQAAAAGFAVAGTCALCYWLGSRVTRASAVAAAVASAEARAAAIVNARTESAATAQVAVIVDPSMGARAVGDRYGLDALDRAEWRGPAIVSVQEQDVAEQMLEDVAGMADGDLQVERS